MRKCFSWAVIVMALMIVACGKKHDDKAVNPNAPVPPKSIISEDKMIGKETAKLYGNIQFVMDNQEEDADNLSVFEIFSGDVVGHFKLDKSGKKYWVKAIDDEAVDDLYADASFVFGLVDGHAVTICYDKELMPLWTMVGFQSENEYNQYRKDCYNYALTGKYKNSEGAEVTITADGKVKGLYGESEDSFELSSINTYITDICRLESGHYFSFSVKNYGLDLLDTEMDEEIGVRMTNGEVLETLESVENQNISWIHKHILTSDYYNYISTATRKRMIEELKARKSPSQTDEWNLFVLENFKDAEAEDIQDEEE